MKITPFHDRVLVRLAHPNKEKSEGGIFIPKVAQKGLEPKVFEAEVLAVGPDLQGTKCGCLDPKCTIRDVPPRLVVGDRVLIPNRVLGDVLTDGTVMVRYSELFGKVEDSKLITAAPAILVPELR